MKEKNKDKTLSLAVTESLIVRVIPNDKHEFLMTTKQVASGYGCRYETIKSSKNRHKDELVEGVHYIPSVQIEPMGKKGANNANIYWTKAGIVRLGFFVKSDRAKLFRDWAEHLILRLDRQVDLFGNTIEPYKQKKVIARAKSRLSQSDILSVMLDVCQIEDSELRKRITFKLVGKGMSYDKI